MFIYKQHFIHFYDFIHKVKRYYPVCENSCVSYGSETRVKTIWCHNDVTRVDWLRLKEDIIFIILPNHKFLTHHVDIHNFPNNTSFSAQIELVSVCLDLKGWSSILWLICNYDIKGRTTHWPLTAAAVLTLRSQIRAKHWMTHITLQSTCLDSCNVLRAYDN